MHPETLQCRVVLRFLDGRTGAFFGNDFVTRNVDLVRESNGTYRRAADRHRLSSSLLRIADL